MATTVRDKSLTSGNETIQERITIDIPQSDMMFFQFFADKMGWRFKNKQTLWKEYLKNSPQNIALSDDEIMEEVRTVRYGKV